MNKGLMKEGVRPVPLLMHLASDDTQEGLLYWNDLRLHLKRSNISVHFYEDAATVDGTVVIPHYLNDYSKKELASLVEECKQAKQVVAFHDGSARTIAKHLTLQFRLNNTNNTKRSVSIPAWLYELPVADPPTGSAVSVSFVGNTSYPGKLNSVFQYIQLPLSIINVIGGSLLLDSYLSLRYKQVIARYVRKAVVQRIQNFSQIQTTLIQREGAFFHLSTEEKQKRRKEYLKAVTGSWYTVCVRGDQNGFFQLYEVMALGRIPIIISTNTR
ncbi:MAG: hypothetical protein WBA23_25275, partial [Tunicatimonas sp.]|uniref:hypothetical protein n=1 Tax=Tunicatimonas sp. TaxID=1940096 RepID=UPI003C71C4F8